MTRIAVYGSLRRDEYNYRPAMGEPIAVGTITNAQLYSLGAYPCIVATDNPLDTVVVEVYDLPDDIFNPIERMELMAGYHRKAVSVTTNTGDEVNADAYFYPQVPDYHDGIVASGDWSKR